VIYQQSSQQYLVFNTYAVALSIRNGTGIYITDPIFWHMSQPVFDKITQGFRHPQSVWRELNRQYHIRRGEDQFNPDGIQVFERDWDFLVILDACRYDMFAEEAADKLPGQLNMTTSRASCTGGYIEANFGGRDLRDTVYVTANPMIHNHWDHFDINIHNIVNLWETDWDSDERTVLPENVTKAAIDAAESYPNKRLVIHYIQPHYPFIGHTIEGNILDDDVRDVWNRRWAGDLTFPSEKIWSMYRNNLTRAIPHVNDLMEKLDGKIVVSSDHGNIVGERAKPIPVREWGHPPRMYLKELTNVPWHTFESESRRNITKGDATGDQVQEDIKTRLNDLGYV
jgi:hypothetical protein